VAQCGDIETVVNPELKQKNLFTIPGKALESIRNSESPSRLRGFDLNGKTVQKTAIILFLISVVIGLLVLFHSVSELWVNPAPGLWLLVFATGLSSFFPVRLPSLRTAHHSVRVTVSDIFIFMAILVISPEAATILASVDCIFGNIGTKRVYRILVNLMITTSITFFTGKFFYILMGTPVPLSDAESFSLPLFLASFIAGTAVYFVLSSGLISLAASLTLNKRWFPVWKRDFLLSSLVNLTGPLSSASIFLGLTRGGSFAMAALVPVILILYYSHRVNSQRIEALRKSQDFLQSTLNSLTTSVAILDMAGSILAVNQAWRKRKGHALFGVDHRVGTNYLETCQTVPATWRNAAGALVEAVEQAIGGVETETCFEYSSDDEANPDSFAVKVTCFEENGKKRIVVTHDDITELRKAETRVIRLAYYDQLTGLPNRMFVTEYLNLALNRPRKNGIKIALMAIKLKDFERINSTFGFRSGELVLVESTRRLLRRFSRFGRLNAKHTPEETWRISSVYDRLARTGDDEFLVILTESETSDEIAGTASEIQKLFAEPFILGELEVFVTINIGITLIPGPYGKAETLMQQAETAVQYAGGQGTNICQYYSKTLNSHSVERISIESRLRKALGNEDFTVLYQPRIRIEDSRINGAEALIRLTDRPSGITMPSQFIPIAEETGLIIPMTEWILLKACLQAKKWHDLIDRYLAVSVNISVLHLQEGNLVRCVEKILDKTDMDPRFLELEITEGVLLDDFESSHRVLTQLRDLGIGIALDDFGTGYSSLSYLGNLPITTVKIDRMFLNDMWNNRSIIKAIVAAAKGLRLRTVAEGVETKEQLAFVREIGCSEIQGFYFSPPIPAAELDQEWLVESSTSPLESNCRLRIQTPA